MCRLDGAAPEVTCNNPPCSRSFHHACLFEVRGHGGGEGDMGRGGGEGDMGRGGGEGDMGRVHA